jgi:pimeloyl-ACP methyl ester carboxylesterase
MVLWDQRGAGRTFRKTGRSVGPTMTLERMTEDGIEVAEFVRAHLHKDKLVLIGHSWGSILGIRMIRQRPDLFAAYIGTGQVVNMRKNEELNYAHVLAQAQAAHNREALQSLTSIGPPPYDSIRKVGMERKWADELAARSGDDLEPRGNLGTPGMSLADLYYTVSGFLFSQEQLFGEKTDGPIWQVDLPALGLDFALPVFFFEGTQDQQTPIELAEQYFNQIQAPHKEFVRFEGDHHFVAMNHADAFLRELLARVRPILVSSP